MPPNHIVLSSGAGSPENAGVSSQVVATFAGKVPILGIGLGIVIAKHYGAQIVPAKRIAHGKSMTFKRPRRSRSFMGLEPTKSYLYIIR